MHCWQITKVRPCSQAKHLFAMLGFVVYDYMNYIVDEQNRLVAFVWDTRDIWLVTSSAELKQSLSGSAAMHVDNVFLKLSHIKECPDSKEPLKQQSTMLSANDLLLQNYDSNFVATVEVHIDNRFALYYANKPIGYVKQCINVFVALLYVDGELRPLHSNLYDNAYDAVDAVVAALPKLKDMQIL